MDTWTGIAYYQLPLLLLAGGVVLSFFWWHHEGVFCRLAGGTLSSGLKALCVPVLCSTWLALTLLSWWCVLDWAFLTVLTTYAAYGAAGGWIAFIGEGVLLVALPVAWGSVLFGLARREFRYGIAAPSERTLRRARPPLRTLPG